MEGITASVIFSVVVAGGGAIGSWYVVRYKVNDLLEKQKRLDEELSTAVSRINDVRSRSAHELAEFKLEVAKEYATSLSIRNMENRLMQELHSLRDIIMKQHD